ncbi:MAG: hypothetical protein EOP11_00885, partial [Proteobacteria bacterium]
MPKRSFAMRLSPSLHRFLARESSSGFVLAICTLFALIIANSPLGAAYDSFFHLKVGPFSLQHW